MQNEELFSKMLNPSLEDGSRVTSLAQLLFAEEVLDEMVAQGQEGSLNYLYLKQRATEYVKANPALLSTPWLRVAGAVFDIIEAVRNEYLDNTIDVIQVEEVQQLSLAA